VIVISNTSPIHYLALTETIDILSSLFAEVIVPPAVRQGRRQDRDTAAVLAKAGSWTTGDLDRPPHAARLKTISLLALAESCPTPPVQLLDLAEKLNYDRRFPHHFLRKTIQRLRRQVAFAPNS
jgi:hypothetical protein